MPASRTVLYIAEKSLWVIAFALCASLRIQYRNEKGVQHAIAGKKNFIVAFWHGGMLTGWFIHRPRGARRIAALVSRSKDGALLDATLKKWGYEMIRGSSHIGGKEAMQLMEEEIRTGASLCITPDGPTGPRHQMKMGAVRLAQKTGVPLFLAGIGIARKKTLGSWDRFEIPMPWSRAAVVYSDPITVPDQYTGEGLDHFKSECERQLIALNAEAAQIIGILNPGTAEGQ
jgi:lysophospholipid acyltransferase (LPLAT)-like uncharacterized protein